ncbi:sulfatase family protein [Tichowtungia aerotolerans]|uniref:Sulfatase-like hydrolase/transferase n=1 Tax=Tichowtungia aerotolerans TaxID=2697043 RepID=A0A6P1M481_9BACT|nr:sulfatase-like hydrolase/transferase [Tichowtungia aerotolerans]QHI68842.1 sulfatase-like hydrolase/transferase [Tichowtungia aerotolerans]
MSDKQQFEMSRRSFLGTGSAALGAGSLFYPSNARGQARAGVPNIIFIHVDQMSLLDSIGAYGAEYVHTPGVDRIVRNGTSFMQSFSTDPVCCPARTAWWSGMYSSENGVIINNTPCHSDTPDLSPLLQQGGYNTYYVGKWHVPGKAVRQLFHVLHEGSWWGELTDQAVTRSARAFLRNYNDRQPFFLSVGYLNPHDICITPSSEYERAEKTNGKRVPRYVQEKILSDDEIPPLPEAHEYDRRELSIQVVTHRGRIDVPKFSDWSDDLWRIHRYNYHRLIEMVDHEIELLLNELDHSAWRENTLIVFSSDHGEGMARHWGIGKSTFYEEVVKVPFVVATLGDVLSVRKNVQDTKHLVSGIDFGRTICDYAGVDASALPHGRSLRPLVDGTDPSSWREYVYAECSAYAHMISDGRFKYIRGYEEEGDVTGLPPSRKTHPVGVEQLFDLQADPGEQHNMAYDRFAQELLAKLRNAMDREEERILPLRPVPHSVGLNFMKTNAELIRKRNVPKTWPVS